MDPVLIAIGLVLGLLPVPARVKLAAIAVLALVRALLGGYESGDGVADFILSLIVAAANLGIGYAIGMVIGLAIEGRRRPSRRR